MFRHPKRLSPSLRLAGRLLLSLVVAGNAAARHYGELRRQLHNKPDCFNCHYQDKRGEWPERAGALVLAGCGPMSIGGSNRLGDAPRESIEGEGTEIK